MKKILPLLISTVITFSSFIGKKSIAVIGVVAVSTEVNAQFSNTYNPADSVLTNVGAWSFQPLYRIKDSTTNSHSSFLRVTTKYFEARSLGNGFYTTQKPNFIMTDASGFLYPVPTGSISIPYSQITGLSAGTGISFVGGVISNTASAATYSNVAGFGITLNQSGTTYTISKTARTQYTVSHSLMTTTTSVSFSISATQDYQVSYSIYTQVTSALAGNNTADSYLEISSNNSAPWSTIAQGGVMVSGVLSTSGGTQNLTGLIPATYYARIRCVATGSNLGSAVFTYKYGQEFN